MRLALDKQGNRALYLQIVDALRQKIEAGRLPPFTRLPSSRQLAKELGVNRITVVSAYAELAAEGLIKSHVGQGTFVADIPPAPPGDPPAAARKIPPPWRTPAQNLPRYNWSPNQMVREMMRLARLPGIISFAAGTAANDFLPVVPFRRALNEVLRRDGA
ncbi:MAG: GntR family transcriptional regulator, partial [Anaerolineae bacterium]